MRSDTVQHVTLLVPGLLGFPGEGDAGPSPLSMPAVLARLLARADRLSAGLPTGYEARLFPLFGIRVPPGEDLPVAAVTRLADMGVVDRDWWVRADPVYLEPRHDGLILHPVALAPDEAASLAAELSVSLAADGWLLRAPRPQRWYLKPPAATPGLVTTPVADVVGRDIRPFLPAGPGYRAWHTRLNELQILLHTATANAAREARGDRPANSVWFWGGGRLPDAGRPRFDQVWSDEPLAQGLARLCGVSASSLPADGAGWLAAASAASESLLVIESLQAASLEGDPQAWEAGLRTLIDDWLAPLRAGVEQGTLGGLSLLADTGPLFQYRRAHRLRFWRRTRPLSAYRAA